ncbi:hypothetical protein [Streptomyces azureus]|uniref:Uncharacterized protein n=1 Tax=Streptomyces azureus TaxID=146537 RepID=A0A0K8PG87_STRAJ|nr:hypothetical protein [Streptomyces azureus]GAP46892.1 predicted protein [Streptomyces azureus]
MTEPIWWPQVLAATSLRRQAAGMLLAHATPTVVGGTLRLTFARADVAAAWRDSGAQAALEGAMQHCGVAIPVHVRTLTTQEV